MKIRNFFGNHKILLVLILGIIGFFGIGTAILGVRIVPSGYKGVYTRWGSIAGTADEGFHWVNIWTGEDIINLDTQIHIVELKNQSIGTIDQQEAFGDVAINYQIEEGYVMEIYKTLRTDWETRVVKNNMQDSLKSVTAQFKAEEFLQKREVVRLLFRDGLRERLKSYHIWIVDVQLENFQFGQAYQDQLNQNSLLEKKALEEQINLEVVKYQQQQEILKQEANATMMKIQAEADANVTLTLANADAQKTLIQSSAQAESQRMINAELSEIYLRYLALRQWNGELSYYYGSDSPIPFLDTTPPTP
jgi:regulator of protease activity HflC (stomatin/prohibitin superfamily)